MSNRNRRALAYETGWVLLSPHPDAPYVFRDEAHKIAWMAQPLIANAPRGLYRAELCRFRRTACCRAPYGFRPVAALADGEAGEPAATSASSKGGA